MYRGYIIEKYKEVTNVLKKCATNIRAKAMFCQAFFYSVINGTD